MIPQYEPLITEDDIEEVGFYMRSGGWLTEHKVTALFEKKIADFVGSKYCAVTNNGTISLALMMMACGIKAGDEIIVPNYTMIATPNAVKLVGATPVFVDIDKSLCADFDGIKNALTDKTKAVLFVIPNGNKPLVPIKALSDWCEANRILLFEDAAQAFGTKYSDGRMIGTVGICGAYSFSPHKIITTGQGGAVVTNNYEIAQKIENLKDFGRDVGGQDVHHTIGYNFKFTDLQAAVGVSQILRVEQNLLKKQWMYGTYQQYLKDYMIDNGDNPPWFIQCLFPQRNNLIGYLLDAGIDTRRMYPPINKQKAYKDHRQSGETFPYSEYIGENGLWLPSSLNLQFEKIKFISETILKFYGKL